MAVNPGYSVPPPAFDGGNGVAAATVPHEAGAVDGGNFDSSDASAAEQRLQEMGNFLADIDPVLAQYARLLSENGYDTPKLLSYALPDDFDRLGIPIGHQRALGDLISRIKGRAEANAPPAFADAVAKEQLLDEYHKEQQLQPIPPPLPLGVDEPPQPIIVRRPEFQMDQNPTHFFALGTRRASLLITVAIILGLCLMGAVIEFGFSAELCYREATCPEWRCENINSYTFRCSGCGHSSNSDFACVNTVTIFLCFITTFPAFMFVLVALRLPCVTGVLGSAFVPLDEADRSRDACCCTEENACCNDINVCLNMRKYWLGYAEDRYEKPRPMRFKTALRAAYSLTFMSLPMGWWYSAIPFELLGPVEARALAFLLLTVCDCIPSR